VSQHIVAMGGGGFSMEPDNPLLDQYVLNLVDKPQPKVCFLGQATAESADYKVRFYEAFTQLGAIPTSLSLFGNVPHNWHETILAQDVIYVGGGNTRSMLALWREWGMDKVLRQALANGIVLTGVSAGAICWFEEFLTDSVFPMGRCPGLGFLKGSACPHYDGEVERRPTLTRLVQAGEMMAGLALDDGAAAHFVDGDLWQIVTSRPHANGYTVALKDSTVAEEKLEKLYLGAS
jgi:dipeptidase E